MICDRYDILINFVLKIYFRNLGKAVARIIAVALDVNEDFFDQPNLLGNALSYYNFNHYGGQLFSIYRS